MFCSKCGKELADTAVICPECGSPTALYEKERVKPISIEQPIKVQVEENLSPRSRATAIILCVLLGFVGAHRFYTGKTGTGVLYIIMFTVWCIRFIDLELSIVGNVWLTISFFLLPVLVIVDLVMIIGGSFCDSRGKRLSR